jgi:HEAT repeat protein
VIAAGLVAPPGARAQVAPPPYEAIDPPLARQIEVLQDDASARNRLAAVHGLGQFGDTAAIPALARAAAFDADRNVRIAAGDTIAAIRGQAAAAWARPPAAARPDRPFQVVRESYEAFLQRPMNAQEVRTVRDALRNGSPAEELQAAVLASDEYFRLHESRPARWVANMFNDVLGRQPEPREATALLQSLRRNGGSREAVAREFMALARDELARRPLERVGR